MEHVRAEFVEGMKKDMYDYFIDNQKYMDEKLMFPELFEVDNATGAYEKHTTVIGAGNLIEKAEGEQISYTRVGEGWTVQSTWKTYAAGLDFVGDGPVALAGQYVENCLGTDDLRAGCHQWRIAQFLAHARYFLQHLVHAVQCPLFAQLGIQVGYHATGDLMSQHSRALTAFSSRDSVGWLARSSSLGAPPSANFSAGSRRSQSASLQSSYPQATRAT